MKLYELAVILRADKEENEVKRDMEAIKALLESYDDCEIINMDPWNRRKLAYPIKGQLFGFYVVYIIRIAPSLVSSLRTELSLQDAIVRFMIIELDEEKRARNEQRKAAKKNPNDKQA